ncbi:GNAT family N-acetyltransferase [Myxococcota bacterium]|nr:GNAT family N-acetyltransferase [Myxococcota bacterium]MBU1537705.1 GNAT family N-acetyltransferase [Myxococcota bacterium]
MALRVEEISWSRGESHLAAIRREVFIKEQACPVHEEFDGLDDGSRHLLAWWDSQPVGCARIRGSKIERMAVLMPFRGRGIAGALLEKSMELARESGEGPVHLHAQTHAMGLYARWGFTPVGEGFMEAGIPHFQMILPR